MKKKVMGILSIVPVISLFLALFIVAYISLGTAPDETLTGMKLVIAIIGIVSAFCAGILCWVDIIWFIIHACKNPRLDTTGKVLWGIGLYFLNVFIFPVYWCVQIRKDI